MHIHLDRPLSQNRDIHILYLYTDEEAYKRQSLTYIEEGIAAGERVIFIDNERFTSLLQRELRSRLSKEEQNAIHFINSLYFYQSSGSYNPSAIKQYYRDTICPYLDNDILFRSWAHVEWSSVGEPYHLIRDCESFSEEVVNQYAFPQVCAYNKNRVPASLAKVLLETHSYQLTENELAVYSHSVE